MTTVTPLPTSRELRVLLVEDDPTSAEIARGALGDCEAPRMLHAHVRTLAEARTLLRKEDFDVVLLDLGLPDSSGLETLDAVRILAPELAIVVLTGLEFDDMALAALRRGADDYLYKGEFDDDALERSVRHSTERRRMLNELEKSQRRRNLSHALRSLTRIKGLRSTPFKEGGGPRPGSASLREVDPDAFAKLAERYGILAEESVNQLRPLAERAETLWELAGTLAERRVEAADAVDLHTVALTRKLAGQPSDQAERYVQAGRLLLIDLMGLLAKRYRDRAGA